MDIREIYEKYANIDEGDLSNNQKDFMYSILGKTQPEDLQTLEEHRMYVEILQKLRKANMKDMERIGAKFLDTLKSLLAVGEDGVYSNSQRFIYELIQNVDDCEYEHVEDCQLDIQFDGYSSPGKIVLTYNEKGFRPENVFAITGIAEQSKNISKDKVEIGEKGIGFKSVFGIADKVHIESGNFSFELHRDNFTIPIPRYEGFIPVKGTRLTLEMPSEMVNKVYHSMAEQYMTGDAALNQNPILFLNKLTHLRMHLDDQHYIVFDAEREQPEMVAEDIAFEDNIIVSVDMKDADNGKDGAYSSIISCRRYTQPIVYGEAECKARYGENVPFSERRHNLIVLFPEITEDLKGFEGILYSFLPTQIHLTVPVVMHIPFKLDGSREFVDPQGENLWFSYTIERLVEFLKRVYVHLASVVKQDVIFYIPSRHNFFFKKTSEKIQCLRKNELKGDVICMEKIFYTADGSYENVKGIVSFAKNEELKNPEEVFALLGENSKLFIPNPAVDMLWYGAKVLSNVPALLFKRGLRNEANLKGVVRLLDTIGRELKYEKYIEECVPLEFTKEQLLVIENYKPVYKAFTAYVTECLRNDSLPELSFSNEIPVMDETFRNEIKPLIDSVDLDPPFEKYLKTIGLKFYALEGVKNDFAMAGKDGIALAEGAKMTSFASLTEKFDARKVFAASLRFRAASDQLNDADESMSDSEYLKLLRSVRNGLKTAFGIRMYNSYIQIINQAGMDKNRFLNELLQNADDCKYAEDEQPEFDLSVNGNIITVSYNECGFTKQNVRAITAIGESTKKLLLDGQDQSIGEKGVGFKSVFGVAESVEIHSNKFDFKLTDKMPTVPDKCAPLEGGKKVGTTMIFSMKEDVRTAFEKDKILRLCFCLRNLKRINIQGNRINISDSETERVVSIDDERYCFEKFIFPFEIDDDKAISERTVNQRSVSKEQRICFYIPKDHTKKTYELYVGLPTAVECNVPLVIDAPFELTTARDNVVKCRWNEIVRENIYDALFELMNAKKEKLRIDILKYASAQTFSEGYLNRGNLVENIEKLKSASFLPVLNTKDKYVAAKEENCLIVPEIVAFISEKHPIEYIFHGVIIDTKKKNQYGMLLERIGCKRSTMAGNLSAIEMVAHNMIKDKKFRDLLYAYLQQPETQAGIRREQLYSRLKNLPIFPVRTGKGVEYVPYSKKIYIHEEKVSDIDFLILETKVMKLSVLQTILGEKVLVNELTPEVYEAKYRNNLKTYIENKNIPMQNKALYILNEYRNNRLNFEKCELTLKGMIRDIPMEMLSGNFRAGNKFLNKNGLIFGGSTIKDLIVSDRFRPLAQYLGCTDVLAIHYDDIDLNITELSDEDIDDFQSEFKFYAEILGNFIEDGIITKEQIVKFNLQYLTTTDDDDDDYEDFPGHAVADLKKLQKHVRNQFRDNPNPYIERRRVVHEPREQVNKETYTVDMYASVYNPQKCFCQMCGKLVSKNYIERNDIQKNPKYGWAQMYLSLCLNCSKDYILLRNNTYVWEKFIKSILEADVEGEETVKVEIGNRELTFTAVHLAEIQTILEVEKEAGV